MIDELGILVKRLKKINIEIQCAGNYPWIYLESVNGNRIKSEDYYNGNHGFTISWASIKIVDTHSTRIYRCDLPIIFKIIRKYL